MTLETVVLEKTEGLGTITLNTPDKMNAMSMTQARDLSKCIDDVETDESIRAVILTGAGKGFCAGADMEEMDQTVSTLLQGGSPLNTNFGPNLREDYDSFMMIAYRLNRLSKPTIAAVNGSAIGAGFSLCLACDMRIASENARFQMAFVKRGIIPDMGGTFHLPRLVGIAKACEIVLVDDIIGAQEALAMGLVNKVVPHEELMKTTLEMANKLIKNSPLAVKMAKKALYQSLMEPDLLHHLRYEFLTNRLLLDGEDFQEGILSFMEKRQRHFTGKWRSER
jgi:2-(1,2-epoxy-1,2-dihydrophenyl)acetyl-CoA isomerase